MHCWYCNSSADVVFPVVRGPFSAHGPEVTKNWPPLFERIGSSSASIDEVIPFRSRSQSSPAMAEYAFPPFHSFPPSYTRQPVEATRAKQTQLWCDLIRDYCRVYRIFWLDVSVARESNLFSNAAIDRRLSDEDVRYFLGQLVARGDAEWDPDRKRCLVFWRRPSDWGQLIYQWVDATGKNGELLTVHEIRKGTATMGRGMSVPPVSSLMPI